MAVHGHGAITARIIGRLAIAAVEHIIGGEVSATFIRSSCRPLLKGLQSASKVLNGPACVSFIPSGNSGRWRNPIARSLYATEPFSGTLSAATRVTYEPNPAPVSFVAASDRAKKFTL